jgi:nitrate/nitrite transport system substrate-binding protein
MGAVFRALDLELARDVALKILHPGPSLDSSLVARFRNEARACAQLNHDNIARVFYAGSQDGLYFIAYEFASGRTIRDLIVERGHLTIAEAVNYAIQVTLALNHIAAAGVVHRDIKPSNIMLTDAGRVKVVDLGLARRDTEDSIGEITVAGTTLGTFDYIAPEQARDPRNADVRSDIYSLGCTMYHMLTGQPPYPEGTALQKLLDHQGKTPPDPRSMNQKVPEGLAAIMRKMMANNPDQRYLAAGLLLNDLMRMGHYSDRAQLMAQSWETNAMKADLWQLLEQGSLSHASESQKRICYDLIKMAGGVEEAFNAAFGPQAQEFFTDTLQSSTFRRREFLIKVAAAAAVVTLTGCPSTPPPETPSKATPNTPNTPPAGVEKTNLKVGFLPITCATPIIMSEPLGFYTKYGLKVELVKMPSWAAIRDSAIAGELDAYHMLSPMPISMSLGLGSTAFPIKLASIENINGQSISVANQHLGKVKEAKDFKGFSIGVPFAFSMHNLLLRYYLAAGGLEPDKDVQIQVIPPPDAIAKMTAGQLDAFLLPDNVVQRSVFNKIGFIHLLTKDIWAGHPCCAFAASQKWIDTNPNTYRAINKAIIDGAGYANDPKHREEIAKAIAAKVRKTPRPKSTGISLCTKSSNSDRSLSEKPTSVSIISKALSR